MRASVLPASMRGGILLKLTTPPGSGNDKSSPLFPEFRLGCKDRIWKRW